MKVRFTIGVSKESISKFSRNRFHVKLRILKSWNLQAKLTGETLEG